MPRKFNTQVLRFDVRAMADAALVLCILLGVALRFVGLNWDGGFHLHPDERFLCIITPQLSWPQSFSAYFDSRLAPLNPFNHDTDFFVYGQLPLLIVKALAGFFGRDDYQNILLVGRFISATFESATLLLILLIGRRAVNTRTGLLAAALLGFSALHIQHAHFWVVDTFAVFFLVSSFYLGMLAFEGRSRTTPWHALACGACWGAAVACKFSSVLFFVAIATFVLLRLLKRTDGDRRMTAIWLVLIILVGATASFRVFHPIAFVGAAQAGVFSGWGLFDLRPNPQFWNALAYQQKISSGQIDVPFNLQWHGRTAFLWPLWNLGQWALGWPILLCAAFGIALAFWRKTRPVHPAPAIVVAAVWCLVVLIFFGAQFSKFTRYYLVATPFAALLGAWFLLEMRSAAKSRTARFASAALAVGVIVASAAWALAVASIYTRPHPRLAASEWIRQNIPTGSAIANETAWDDALPLQNRELYHTLNLDLFAPDDESKRQNLLQQLDATQWIFVSSPRVAGTVPRLPERFPLTSEYFRALLDGRLGFRLAQEFVSYPQLGPMVWRDANVEEALHVYDHPRVLLFEKTEKYSSRSARAVLSGQQLNRKIR